MILEKYGDIIELDWKFPSSVVDEINNANFGFHTRADSRDNANETRTFVDLIGSTDSADGHTYNPIGFNENIDKVPSLKPFLDRLNKYGGLFKARIYKLDNGSYYEPHRDHMGFGERFRIMCPLNHTNLWEYTFFYEDRLIFFKERVPYYINTGKVHGSTTYVDGTYHLTIALDVDGETEYEVAKLLSIF